MRLSNAQAVARPNYYDRNVLNVTKQYTATNVAPHGITQRWSYTVPAGRKTMVDLISGSVVEAAAYTAQNIAYNQIIYTPSGGVATTLDQALMQETAVLNRDKFTDNVVGVMLAGDTLVNQTQDPGTVGNSNYTSAAKLFEFDA